MKNTLSHLIGLVAFVASFLFALNLYNFLYTELIHIPEVKAVEEEKVEFISCAIGFRETDISELSHTPEKFVEVEIATEGFIHLRKNEIVLSFDKCANKRDLEGSPILQSKNNSLRKILERKGIFQKGIKLKVFGSFGYLVKRKEKITKINVEKIELIKPIWNLEKDAEGSCKN